MKNKIIVFNLLIAVLFISGCGCDKKNEKTVTCTMEKQFEDYDYNAEIKIVYDDETNELYSINENEIFISSDKDFLNNIKRFDESLYSIYNEIDGAKYSMSFDDDDLIRNMLVDYKKVDKEKLLTIDKSQKRFFNEDNIATLDNAIKYYEGNGNICE